MLSSSNQPRIIIITSNRTALAKLTGISPLHGSHAAIPIACGG